MIENGFMVKLLLDKFIFTRPSYNSLTIKQLNN
jgi:hypothetical protein